MISEWDTGILPFESLVGWLRCSGLRTGHHDAILFQPDRSGGGGPKFRPVFSGQ